MKAMGKKPPHGHPEFPGMFGEPSGGKPHGTFKTPYEIIRASPLFTERRQWAKPQPQGEPFNRAEALAAIASTKNKGLLEFQARALLDLAYARLAEQARKKNRGAMPRRWNDKDLGRYYSAIMGNRLSGQMAAQCIRECWEIARDTGMLPEEVMGDRQIYDYLVSKGREFGRNRAKSIQRGQ